MKTVSDKAAEFAVWRARRTLGDDATLDAIASRARLHPSRVRAIIMRRGWHLAAADGDGAPPDLSEEFL